LTQAPQPGWYADPSGLPAYRWWDGQAWTEHISSAQPPTPVAQQSFFAPTPAPQPAGFAPTAQHTGFAPSPMQTGYAPMSSQNGFAPTPLTTPDRTPQYAPAPARGRSQASVWQSNHYAFITLMIVAAYALIAWKGHVYVLGIFPAAMSIRSMSRREPLAFLAVIAAVAAVLIAVVGLTHH
jgi:hypothetical protein